MMAKQSGERDLGDGLVVRWATSADIERVAGFVASGFRGTPDDPPHGWDDALIRVMMSGRHPLVRAEDFVYVEDTTRGAVVASSCLMWQRWEYEGIPFTVGRPEIVVTDHHYRQRGLIRAIFASLHDRSAALGQPVQAITGIPYFYRQFGYEYALALSGGRAAYGATIPDAPAGEPEPYTLRNATPADLDFIHNLYDDRRRGYLVSAEVPEEYWRFVLTLPGDDFDVQWRLHLILDRARQPVGYLRTGTMLSGGALYIWDIAVRDGVWLHAVGPPILRALLPICQEAAKRTPYDPPVRFGEIRLFLPEDHPFYAAIGDAVAPRVIPPYAWYIRVPDLSGFLRLIAPVLEHRLAASVCAGYSGEIRLDFFRSGLCLGFTDGHLTTIEPWRRPAWGERPQATFPPLVFLQLLFGYRGLAELFQTFPDVTASAEATILLKALFPRRVSWAPPLD